MQDDKFWDNATRVFEQWIEIENDNLTRVRARLLKCRMPYAYRTNGFAFGGWTEHWFGLPNAEQFEQTTFRLKEFVEWVGHQLHKKGDIVGAAKAALLYRHLDDSGRGSLLDWFQSDLNALVKRDGYVYAGVDYIAETIKDALVGKRVQQEPGEPNT